MATWVCKACKAEYSVGAPRCPQCGSTRWAERGAKGDPLLTTEAVPEQQLAEAGDGDA